MISPQALRMAMAELLLEASSPIDSALYAWAITQEEGVVKAFSDRFFMDRLREILYERARIIEDNLPDELESLG